MLRRAVDNLVPQKRLRSVFEYLRQNMQKLQYAGAVVVGIETFATIHRPQSEPLQLPHLECV